MAKQDFEIQGKLITNQELRREATKWAEMVRNQARANASRFPTRGKGNDRLRSKTTYKLREINGVLSRVYFRMPLHGAFRTFGAGRGRSYKNIRTTSQYKARTESDWISSPLDNETEKLADIVADFYGDYILETWALGGALFETRRTGRSR